MFSRRGRGPARGKGSFRKRPQIDLGSRLKRRTTLLSSGAWRGPGETWRDLEHMALLGAPPSGTSVWSAPGQTRSGTGSILTARGSEPWISYPNPCKNKESLWPPAGIQRLSIGFHRKLVGLHALLLGLGRECTPQEVEKCGSPK